MKRVLSAKWAMHKIACGPETVPSVCGGCCGDCQYLGPNGCTFPPNEKPVGCHLFPMILNKKGNIVRRFRCQHLCKGNFNAGDKIIIESLYDSFVNLFGKEQTDAAIESVKQGKDYTFETSDEFEARLQKQKELGVWHGFLL